MGDLSIRLLEAQDAAAYQHLRLRSLAEHPEAFGASVEEEARTPLEKIEQMLERALPDNPVFGACLDGELVGIGSLNRYPRQKTKHRAIISGIYVASEARGHGAGSAIMDAILDYGKALPGLETIILAVTVGNESARRIYTSKGFESYSIDRHYFKIDGSYHDIEWMVLFLDDHR
ncbi:MAG: GNAT family protein [bacterium]|nr:GNAT family protein [bacterium]